MQEIRRLALANQDNSWSSDLLSIFSAPAANLRRRTSKPLRSSSAKRFTIARPLERFTIDHGRCVYRDLEQECRRSGDFPWQTKTTLGLLISCRSLLRARREPAAENVEAIAELEREALHDRTARRTVNAFLELDLARHPQQPSLQHRLRLPERRPEILVLRQHHVAVERVEDVERGVDSRLAGPERFPEAQIELVPALQILGFLAPRAVS